ncbi:MAG TPA: DUF2914 domain-containing protein [Candidatus Paceibacterota bacterium]|jgi:hypothetical protein|nr:DUF2914 domain-containing protein [Candidatus Paceibacterota bacterium]
MRFIEPIRNFYGRFERPISSLSLILGFIFYILTLKRVDEFWENFWVIGHLVIVGFFIALIHLQESKEGDEKNPEKAHFWYVNLLQLFFGGILSTYLVFYFRSTDIFVTWPFLAILALAFIANESLKKHYIRFSFQISLFFLSIYSFAIFFMPVVLHRIGYSIFLFSGFLSLAFIFVFVETLFYFMKDASKKDRYENKKMIAVFILGIFALVNILYFTNLIPPIPLSLKEGGIYHSIEKNGTNYYITFENYGWRGYFHLYPNFRETAGKPVYAFSAIFSPKDLNLVIVHEWQHYDKAKRAWETAGTVRLPVTGGRDGGFRTYSLRSDLAAGKWRVNIETEDGHIIGRLRFTIVPSETEPWLDNMVK